MLLAILLTACRDRVNPLTSDSGAAPAAGSISVYTFPDDWAGVWSGTLQIYAADGLKQQLPMSLEILPIDSSDNWTHNIIYGPDREAGLRAYELEPIDAERGFWAVDEKNSIRIEAYYFANQLTQRFEVMNNLLIATTELTAADRMRWEITSGSMDRVSLTGNTVVAGDTIPPVQSFPVVVRQIANLRRVTTAAERSNDAG